MSPFMLEYTGAFVREVQNSTRRGVLAGPFSTHEAALAQVDSVREYAYKHDPRAHWMAFGTAGSDEKLETPLGSDPAKWVPA